MPAKGRQISVRVSRETDAWLERRASGRTNKANFVRSLIEKEMEREREDDLLGVFNEAAADLTEADRSEREALLGAFVGNEEEVAAKAHTKAKAKGKT